MSRRTWLRVGGQTLQKNEIKKAVQRPEAVKKDINCGYTVITVIAEHLYYWSNCTKWLLLLLFAS